MQSSSFDLAWCTAKFCLDEVRNKGLEQPLQNEGFGSGSSSASSPSSSSSGLEAPEAAAVASSTGSDAPEASAGDAPSSSSSGTEAPEAAVAVSELDKRHQTQKFPGEVRFSWDDSDIYTYGQRPTGTNPELMAWDHSTGSDGALAWAGDLHRGARAAPGRGA